MNPVQPNKSQPALLRSCMFVVCVRANQQDGDGESDSQHHHQVALHPFNNLVFAALQDERMTSLVMLVQKVMWFCNDACSEALTTE